MLEIFSYWLFIFLVHYAIEFHYFNQFSDEAFVNAFNAAITFMCTSVQGFRFYYTQKFLLLLLFFNYFSWTFKK